MIVSTKGRSVRNETLHAEGDALVRAFPALRRVRPRLPRPGLAVYDLPVA